MIFVTESADTNSRWSFVQGSLSFFLIYERNRSILIYGMILLNCGLTPCNLPLIENEICFHRGLHVFLLTLIVQISLFIIKTLFHDSLNIFVSYFALTCFY